MAWYQFPHHSSRNQRSCCGITVICTSCQTLTRHSFKLKRKEWTQCFTFDFEAAQFYFLQIEQCYYLFFLRHRQLLSERPSVQCFIPVQLNFHGSGKKNWCLVYFICICFLLLLLWTTSVSGAKTWSVRKYFQCCLICLIVGLGTFDSELIELTLGYVLMFK